MQGQCIAEAVQCVQAMNFIGASPVQKSNKYSPVSLLD